MPIKIIIFDFYKTLYDSSNKSLFPGMKRMLFRLSKKFKLVLITTGGQKRKQIIEKLTISRFFETINIVHYKNQKAYLSCLEKFKVKPSQVLIIGDRKEEEINIGNQLGTKTILVNYQKMKKRGGAYVERKIRTL